MITLRRLTVVRLSIRRPSTPLNDFSSETPGPIFFKHHVEHSVEGGLKICLNGQDSLIKMAAIPIYVKILKNLPPVLRKLLG